jgi:hypothetical protein
VTATGTPSAGEGWTSDRVRDAAATWVWVPPGASEARTPEYHLVAYPPTFHVPTQVAWCRSPRPARAVVDEVLAVVRAWRRPDVSFWVGDRTTPADLGDHLTARGAVHVESVEVLSLALDAPALRATGPAAALRTEARDATSGRLECAGLEVRQVLDAATLDHSLLVSSEVWGQEERTQEDVARQLAELTGPEPTELRVVAYVDGEPAATAGCTLSGDVARLWGGATRPALRGRGAYRATLGARLWLAQQRGATIGLVKAVTTTSAPIVRRLGFTGHGVEHRLRLDLLAEPRPVTDPGPVRD